MRKPVSVLFSIFLVAACGGSRPPPVTTLNPPLSRDAQIYSVRHGDTLFSIARQIRLSYRTLAMWNGITPPYTIHVGQKIKLHAPKKRENPATRISAKPSKSAKTSPKQAQYRSSQKKFEKKLKVIWRWPLTGVIAKKFSQTGRKGIDIVAKAGAVVRAAADGKVVYSGAGLVGYGNLLIIKHSDVLLSAYAKNRRLLVREGQNVRKGQVIAEIGVITGQDPVLHFQIRKNGKPVDPMLYLSKP